MDEDWYYELFGEEFGPVAFSQLQELASAGTLSDSDKVRQGASGPWKPWSQAVTSASMPPTKTATAVLESSSGEEGWYYESLGCQLGPVTFDELLALAESGELAPDDQVQLGPQGKSRRAGSVGRLMAVMPFTSSSREIQEQDSSWDSGSSVRSPQPAREAYSAERTEVVPPVATGKPSNSASSGSAKPPLPPPGPPKPPIRGQEPWFAWIGGVEYGPVTAAELKEWIAEQRLVPTDFVKQGSHGQYVPASSTTLMAPAIPAHPYGQAPFGGFPAPQTMPGWGTQTPVPTPYAQPSAPVRPAMPQPVAPAPTPTVQSTPPTPVAKPVQTPAAAETKRPESTERPSSGASSTSAIEARETAPVKVPEPPAPRELPSEPPASPRPSYSPPSPAANWSTPTRPAGGFTPPAKKPAKKSSKKSSGEGFDLGGLLKGVHPGAIAGLVAVAALVGIWYLMPEGSGSLVSDYQKLLAMATEVDKMRAANASDSEWKAFGAKSQQELEPIAKSLEAALKAAPRSALKPARQQIYFAAKYRFKDVFAAPLNKPTKSEQDVKEHLTEAAKLLGQPPPTLAKAPEPAAKK